MRARLDHTTWNNLGGGEGVRRLGPLSLWHRPSGAVALQAVMALRPFKVGRRSHYLRLTLRRRP